MSTNCDDCIERNPAIPNYSKAIPIGNACSGCGGSGNILFPPSGGASTGKTTEILPGFSIGIDDLSDTLVDRFRVNWLQAVQMIASLVLTAKSAAATKANPVLWGTVIDEVNLTWSYNRDVDVATQTLTNTGGLTEPTLGSSERLFDYTAQVIKNVNTSFTITGADNLGLPESSGNDSKSIIFGNYVIHGVGVTLENGTTAALTAFIEGLLPGGGTNTTTRLGSFFAESVVLERDFYAVPKRFGFSTFSKNGGNGNGGLKRMKDVGGTLVSAVDQYAVDGDETDIPISNGIEAEDFLIYMSVYDNIADAINPITVT